jgi:hypothetical protein
MPAGAVIQQVKDGSETIEVGVIRRQPVAVDKPADTLQWHGGPVDSATYTYAIYWDPVEAYPNVAMQKIDGYLHDVGAASGQLENPFALNAQYRSATGARAAYNDTFRGAYTDTAPYPTNGCIEANVQSTCLTDGQIRTELKRFISSEHLPTGREIVYYVLTPSAVTVCLDEGGSGDCSTSKKELEEEATPEGKVNKPGLAEAATGFCGYHSAIEPDSESPIVYAVQPWVAGHAGHAIQEIPLVNQVATGAALACQNRAVLVEPNQATSFADLRSYEDGLADVIINDLSLQLSDIMDDPLVADGWYQNGSKAEQSDMCRGAFSPIRLESKEEKLEGTEALNVANARLNGKPYYLQYGYSSTGVTRGQGATCWSGVEQAPHFTATNVVKGGDIIAFDALESGLTLDANVTNLAQYELPAEIFTAPIYLWQFGDGTSSGPTTQASVFHTYQYAGNYQVTLTVIDSGGYERTFSQTTPVGSPPAPSPPPTPGVTPPAGSSPPSAGSSGGASSGVTPSPVVGAPAITQNVLSRSLKKAVQLGLAIHYKVNEQVAGKIEVLLAASTAAKLKIKAPAAFGLPAGYPRSVLVGSAVLVTTRAGQGTVRIKFSKTLTKRLAKAHQVKLTLRLVLHSASRPPHTTTQLSTVLLSK